MAYKDKDKQKEANRLAARRRRDKAKGMTQGMTIEGMTQGMTLPTDACGNVYGIDYAGRRADMKQLDDWVAGKGTSSQRAIALTAINYSIINGFKDKAGKLTAQGKQYAGIA